jgi:hypothetical protein
MQHLKAFGIGMAATAGLLGAIAAPASAFTLGGALSAQTFEDLNPNVDISAESRWGSGSVGGNTFELDLHKVNDGGGFYNVDQKEFGWQSGEAVDFALDFDGSQLTYTVGGTILSTSTVADNYSELFIRTAAYTQDSSIQLQNLSFTNGSSAALGDLGSACAIGESCGFLDAEYFHIKDIAGAFSLTGQSILTWGATNPSQSRLAYQVKLVAGDGGSTADVPEPAMTIALGGVALGMLARRRQQRSAQ